MGRKLLLILWLWTLVCGHHFVVNGSESEDYDDSGEEEKCTILPPPTPKSHLVEDPIWFLDLLDNGTQLHSQSPNPVQDAILILGNTGSGKTTLSQILAGNLNTLHAVLTQSKRLVIVDDEEKIGAPSILSKTLIPELLPRAKNLSDPSVMRTEGFYDCPGFDDNRGAEQDIIANFFLNQIVREKVERLKLLFLVPQTSVSLGSDRLDFDLLSHHASTFAKNLGKYENSTALVVTKVKSYSSLGRFLKDRHILANIVEYLTLYRNTLETKLESDSDDLEKRSVLERKLEFVKILLNKNEDGDYDRIYFSRDPEKCGPLSESVFVRKTRSKVYQLLDQLQFTSVSPDDFGFTLKDRTRLKVKKYVEDVKESAVKFIGQIMSNVQDWGREQIGGENGPEILVQRCESVMNELETLNIAVESRSQDVNGIDFWTFHRYLIRFTDNSDNVGFNLSEEIRNALEGHGKYLEFFHDALGKSSSFTLSGADVKSLMEPVLTLLEYYRFQRNFFHFCMQIKDTLGSSSVQLNTRKLTGFPWNGTELESLEWLEANEVFRVPYFVTQAAQGQTIHKVDFQVFLDIMRFALKPMEVECIEGRAVRVTGNFVRFSDLVGSDGKLKLNCYGKDTLEVFVGDTLFVDASLNAEGSELHLLVLAPNWVIVGDDGENRVVNLKGYDGARGEDGKYPWETGIFGMSTPSKHGSPGGPGGPGGSFLGIAGNMEDGNKLRIIASGGNGGRGGDGKEGRAGRDGKDATNSDAKDLQFTFLTIYSQYKSRYYGMIGNDGEDGGNGGAGGLGGFPGEVEIIMKNHDQEAPPKVSKEMGNRGSGGVGGEGGKGGRSGTHRVCEKDVLFWFINTKNSCKTYTSDVRGADGKRGTDNENEDDGLARPREPKYDIDDELGVEAYISIFGQTKNKETEGFIRFVKSQQSEDVQKSRK